MLTSMLIKEPKQIDESMHKPITAIGYILKQIRNFKFSVFIMLFGGVFASVRTYYFAPRIIKWIIDAFTANHIKISEIQNYIIIYMILYAIDEFLYRIGYYLTTVDMMPNMRSNIVLDCLEVLTLRSCGVKQDRMYGEYASKIKDLSDELPNVIVNFMDQTFLRFICIAASICNLFEVGEIFGIMMIIWSCYFIILASISSYKISKLSEIYAQFNAYVNGNIVDTLSNTMSIKLFTARDYEQKRMEKTLVKAIKKEQIMQNGYSIFWILHNLSTFILQGIMFYYICKNSLNKTITIGDISLIIGAIDGVDELMTLFCLDFTVLIKTYGRTSQAINDIMQTDKIKDIPNAKQLTKVEGKIEFQNVQFSYVNDNIILNNISFKIKPGQKIGLISYSGGGKSTIISLLLRLHDVNSGKILIDDQDIAEVSQDSLRNNISVIPQDTILFNRSILENIRYGKTDATDEEVIVAAKQAHAHDFITKLPEGYHTLCGERGNKLSGGQKQRITIARAILKNAPILILDEATSSLDSITEDIIEGSIKALSANRTTIVIAHRLSTITAMDRIFVLENGVIVADGNHQELLKISPTYIELWKSQII